MELSITQVPIWTSILFVMSFSIPILLISNTVKSVYLHLNNKNASMMRNRVIYFYVAYLLLVGIFSAIGILSQNTLPPRIVLFTTIPFLLFYLIYIQKSKWFTILFEKISIEQLIKIHLFRFIGVFFFLLYSYDALPKEFAFIGGTGDILTALFVIPLIYVLRKKMRIAKGLVWVWNIFGLLDIIAVITTAILTTKYAIENNLQGVVQFLTFPFSWIPAFAPATIIFLHVLIFRKLRQNKLSK